MRARIVEVIRPHFPALRLYESLRRRLRGEEALPPNKNRFKSVVQYSDGRGAIGEVEVRDVDGLHLRDPQSREANEHLNLILGARSTLIRPQTEAEQRELEALRLAYRRELQTLEPGDSLERMLAWAEQRTISQTPDSAARAELARRMEQALGGLEQRFGGDDLGLGEYEGYIVPFTDVDGEFTRTQLSNKGYNLRELVRFGYPVPAFCIVTSEAPKKFWGIPHRDNLYDKALAVLERLTGKKYNDPQNPLLFSLRAALPENVPGKMPTYLNLGATAAVFPTLIEMYGEEVALDIRIQHLIAIIIDSDRVRYTSIIQGIISEHPPNLAGKRTVHAALEAITQSSRYVTFHKPEYHLRHFAERILHYAHNNADSIRAFLRFAPPVSAMTLQEMVIGKGPGSYSGAVWTTEPRLGEGVQAVVSPSSFGEELMTGRADPILLVAKEAEELDAWPAVLNRYYSQLMRLGPDFRAPVVAELTVDNGELSILQANWAALSGPVALYFTITLWLNGKINTAEVLRRVRPYHIRQIFGDRITNKDKLQFVAAGDAILPLGDVMGQIYFSNEAALAARARGERVILINEFFTPRDVDTMVEVQGLLSTNKAAIHVGEVARQYGIVALIGLQREGQNARIEKGSLIITSPGEHAETVIQEGDHVAISSEDEMLYFGQAQTLPSFLRPGMSGADVTESKHPFHFPLGFYYEHYTQLVERAVRVEDLEDVEILNNVVSFLIFRGEIERMRTLVNAWFSQRQDDFVDYFMDTDIGKHKPRINLFMALERNNMIAFLKALLEAFSQKTAGAGAFIIGRLLLEYDRVEGEGNLGDLMEQFGDDCKTRLDEEIQSATHYLKVSRVDASKTDSLSERRDRDPFITSLKFRLGDKFDRLSHQEIDAIRRLWDLDPDPTHKPAKTIRKALRDSGFDHLLGK
ncbi:MAG: hypothetical protein HQ596_00440 [Candidatus Saganbacteria bacterium]|nr:hypothetical protein [Candidatus Saganbacteria bacterium]